jgi:DNA-binding XRE family transcriptional regulator
MKYRRPPGGASERVNAVVKKLSKRREKQIRKTYQLEKPAPDQLLASGDIEPLVSQTAFLAAWQAVDALKKARRQAGLSLSQVAARGGVDKATLSRLEGGQYINPTLDTLSRYALALGRGLTLSFPLLTKGREPLSVDGRKGGA